MSQIVIIIDKTGGIITNDKQSLKKKDKPSLKKPTRSCFLLGSFFSGLSDQKNGSQFETQNSELNRNSKLRTRNYLSSALAKLSKTSRKDGVKVARNDKVKVAPNKNQFKNQNSKLIRNSKFKTRNYLSSILAYLRLKVMELRYMPHLEVRLVHDKAYAKGGTYKRYSDYPLTPYIHKATVFAFTFSFAIFTIFQLFLPNFFNLWHANPTLAGSVQRVWNTLADFTNNTGLTGNITLNNIDLNNGDPKLSTTVESTTDNSFSNFSKTGNALIGNTISLGLETVTIGTQTWMAQNLNVGTMLASGDTMPANNSTVEKWCYNNDPANCTTYGGLYSWDEMMGYTTTPGAQGICPTGFKIPTDNDWKILEMHLGMTQAQADATGWRGTDQGTKLKPGGSSGFEGLLAGRRSTGGTFYDLGTHGNFWSSSVSSSNAWRRLLSSANTTVYRYADDKAFGFSVRCLKN